MRRYGTARGGGQGVRDLLTPRIAEVSKAAGKKTVADRFLKDTNAWLVHVLGEANVPRTLWKRCVAVDSHILAGTVMSRLSQVKERVKRGGLAIASYKKSDEEDTSGILVRYATRKYAIQVIDQAQRLCVVVKRRGTKASADDLDKKREMFWAIVKDALSEEIWKPDGIEAALHIWDEGVSFRSCVWRS